MFDYAKEKKVSKCVSSKIELIDSSRLPLVRHSGEFDEVENWIDTYEDNFHLGRRECLQFQIHLQLADNSFRMLLHHPQPTQCSKLRGMRHSFI